MYGIVSDGDLQEGIASEAASLAGHLRLGKLIYLYDDNGIQLDGPTSMAWSEDVPKRFDAYGWHASGSRTATTSPRSPPPSKRHRTTGAQLDRGANPYRVRQSQPRDTQKAHGSPLGEDEVRLTKEAYGWDPDRHFYIPDDVREVFERVAAQGNTLVNDWERMRALPR